MMKPKIIKTEADYHAALGYLETLMDAKPGTSEEDDLALFSVLIEEYEKKHFPIPLPDPIEAIKFRMEQQGLTRKDLIPYIGSQSKVSEVLNGKRPLSISMIRALEKGLGIPAEVLIQEPGGSSVTYSYREDNLETPDNQGEPLSGAGEKVRTALQTIADFIGENSSLYQTHRFARVTEEVGSFINTNKEDQSEHKVAMKPAADFKKALERICMVEDLDLSSGEDPELVVSNWLRSEIRQCFDAFHSGERVNVAHRLYYLEQLIQKHGKNSPLLQALADMLLQSRMVTELPSEKPNIRKTRPTANPETNSRLARADYPNQPLGVVKKDDSLVNRQFADLVIERTRGLNG